MSDRDCSRTRGRWALLVTAALTLVLPMGLAAANDQPEVSVQVEVEREVVGTNDDGEQVTHREPVKRASPGDVLVYTLTAMNVGEVPAYNPQLQDPVPQGTVLIPESVSATGAQILASVDKGESWHAFPVTVTRAAADGSSQRVPVPANAYTNLRWIIPGQFDPGQKRSVSFKVTIQ